jgi:cobalt/nickel transport system ATP-binding protein
MGENIFKLKDVKYSYLGKFPALCGIDLEIDKGQRVAIIGANGSGKSTLLHMLDGLIFPDSGSAEAFGMPIDEKSLADARPNLKFRRKVGFVFQNPDVQLFCPTVKEEIMFGPLHLGFERNAIEEAFDAIVEVFGIKHLIDRMPHQLSIGEKRKVAMASVLVSGPDVVLLDEPTAGLDPRTTRKLIDLLSEYHDRGKTIVTATHDMRIVAEISDTVHVFGDEKRIVASGKSPEILSDIKFLQENNLVHVHAHTHNGKAHVHKHDHLEHQHRHEPS